MEALWADLIEGQQEFESALWHGEVLRETEKKYAAGEIETLDWEAAKKELRARLI